MPGKKRILVIDGGGIRGTFPASLLANMEEHLPSPIGSYFDLIAGTSTGGIIAIGLAMGIPAKTLHKLYTERGPEIFGQGKSPLEDAISRAWRGLRHAVTRKYSSDPLRVVLTDTLGEKKIGDAKTRLLIPAWNPVARSVYIYKTAHHERLRTDYKTSAVDAAMATAAAPTYFSHHITGDMVSLSDGGTWANNPIALAVVEGITLLGWTPDDLHVLSLGCIDEAYAVKKNAGFLTLGKFGTQVLKLFMDGQAHGAMGIAKLLTGHEHRRTAIHRVDHTVPAGHYSLDGTAKIAELSGLGFTLARERFPALQPVFFDQPAEAFIPIYTNDGVRA